MDTAFSVVPTVPQHGSFAMLEEIVTWILLEKRWNSQKLNELLIFSWRLVAALLFVLAFLLCRLFSGISIRSNTTNLIISSPLSLFCSCFIWIHLSVFELLFIWAETERASVGLRVHLELLPGRFSWSESIGIFFRYFTYV